MDKNETALAVWHSSPTMSAIKEEQLPLPREKEILLQSCYSLISVGTERLVVNGQVPEALQQVMAVPFMGGDFTFPIKYGYSLVAKPKEESKKATTYFHLMHPHQDQVLVPNEVLFPIPINIPPKRAVLASNVETALNAIWDSQVSIGDRALVVGFGLIGSLVARLLSMLPSVEVVVIERDPYRLQLAQTMGFIRALPKEDFDIAFNTSATANGLQTCIDRVGKEGKIIEMSWYGKQETSLQLGSSFHYQRKQIISSQVGQIPAQKSHRWDYLRRKQVVFDLLQHPVFDEHLTHEIPFSETPSFFQKLRAGALPNGLAWVIEYL